MGDITFYFSRSAQNPQLHFLAWEGLINADDKEAANMLILPLPAKKDSVKVLDLSSHPYSLQAPRVAAELRQPRPQKSCRVLIANNPDSLRKALEQVEQSERPIVSDELLSALQKNYKSWPLALFIFKGDVSNLVPPAVTYESTDKEFFLAASKLPGDKLSNLIDMGVIVLTDTGKPVTYEQDTISPLLKEFIKPAIVSRKVKYTRVLDFEVLPQDGSLTLQQKSVQKDAATTQASKQPGKQPSKATAASTAPKEASKDSFSKAYSEYAKTVQQIVADATKGLSLHPTELSLLMTDTGELQQISCTVKEPIQQLEFDEKIKAAVQKLKFPHMPPALTVPVIQIQCSIGEPPPIEHHEDVPPLPGAGDVRK